MLSSTNGITLHLESSNVNDVRQVENQANPSVRIAYTSLIEFKDNNGNEGFDPNTDTIVQSFNLETQEYAKPEIRSLLSQDGTQGWELRSHTVDNMFTVATEVFRQTALVNGTVIPPTATKITIMVNNFPFRGPKDPTDRLALQTVLISRIPVQEETVPSRTGLSVRSGTTREFVSWSPTSTVDGRQVPVKSSTKTTDDTVNISLAYARGTSIIHELTLGVIFGLTPLLTSSVLVASAATAFAVFGLLFIAGRRQLSKALLGRDHSG